MNATLLLLILLGETDPFAKVWAHLDKAEFAEAQAVAVALAAAPNAPAAQQQKALELALTAACNIGQGPCLEGAQRLVDWNPSWRPDSRAQPALIAAARQARLSQIQRLDALETVPWHKTKGWCSPPGTQQIIKGVNRASVLALERVATPCVTASESTGFLLALDANFAPLAAYGSPASPRPLAPPREQASRGLIFAAAGALLAGLTVAVYFFRTPPTGALDVRLEVGP